MYCLHLSQPNPQQKNHLHRLIHACHTKEPLTLSLPDDADHYLLICHSGTHMPLSCLIICEVLENQWECYAWTHPNYRQRGLFTYLLSQVRRMARNQELRLKQRICLLLLSDGKSLDGLAAAKALRLSFQYSEHQMTRKKNKQDCLPPPSLLLRYRKTRENNEQTECQVFFAFPALLNASRNKQAKERKPVGTCRLIPYGKNHFYLYHVEIRRELRNKGWGTRLIYALLNQLPEEHTLTLQVSSENKPALRLYKKTGFRITETLSYYKISNHTRCFKYLL